MKDKRIKDIKLFKNDTQYGTIHNATVKFEIDQENTIFFSVKRMPKNNGDGYYYLWPQEVYDKNLAQETNYKKGVNKFLFGNKSFGEMIQNAIENMINGVEPQQDYSEHASNNPNFETIEQRENRVKAGDINLEEIKF